MGSHGAGKWCKNNVVAVLDARAALVQLDLHLEPHVRQPVTVRDRRLVEPRHAVNRLGNRTERGAGRIRRPFVQHIESTNLFLQLAPHLCCKALALIAVEP